MRLNLKKISLFSASWLAITAVSSHIAFGSNNNNNGDEGGKSRGQSVFVGSSGFRIPIKSPNQFNNNNSSSSSSSSRSGSSSSFSSLSSSSSSLIMAGVGGDSGIKSPTSEIFGEDDEKEGERGSSSANSYYDPELEELRKSKVIIDLGQGKQLTISDPMDGEKSLLKRGEGYLITSNQASNFDGGILVEGGTLYHTGAFINPLIRIIVDREGILSGLGKIAGEVRGRGKVYPEGPLTVGDYFPEDGAVLQILIHSADEVAKVLPNTLVVKNRAVLTPNVKLIIGFNGKGLYPVQKHVILEASRLRGNFSQIQVALPSGVSQEAFSASVDYVGHSVIFKLLKEFVAN